ncbi:MAG: hypothetical protein GY947_23400 [Rhodobacteraceae bacterium]|nr:hypothetical protein [Paracoccaceae bacterium]
MAVVRISGVRHQQQTNPRACWYTCLQMGVRFHRERLQSCPANLVPPETIPKMQQRYTAGANPSWAEWRQWAGELGFTAINMSMNAEGIRTTLEAYGPIIYSGTWGNTFDGHVVVLTGIDTSGPTVFVDDPLETTAPVTKDMNTYFARLAQTIWETPLFVYR